LQLAINDIRPEATLRDILISYHLGPPPIYVGTSSSEASLTTASDTVEECLRYTLSHDWDPEGVAALKPWLWPFSRFEQFLADTRAGDTSLLDRFATLPVHSADPRPSAMSSVDPEDHIALWGDHDSFIWRRSGHFMSASDEAQTYDYIGEALMLRPMLVAAAAAHAHASSSLPLTDPALIPRLRYSPNKMLLIQKGVQSSSAGRPDISVVSEEDRMIPHMTTDVKLHDIVVSNGALNGLVGVDLPNSQFAVSSYSRSQKWLVQVRQSSPIQLACRSDDRRLDPSSNGGEERVLRHHEHRADLLSAAPGRRYEDRFPLSKGIHVSASQPHRGALSPGSHGSRVRQVLRSSQAASAPYTVSPLRH
jgi:hypothetical protein